MSATIRLMRFGKKSYPTYRIVVLDKRKKVKGAYIEKIGRYNPMQKPALFEIDDERMQYWLKCGAEISEGMRKILKNRSK